MFWESVLFIDKWNKATIHLVCVFQTWDNTQKYLLEFLLNTFFFIPPNIYCLHFSALVVLLVFRIVASFKIVHFLEQSWNSVLITQSSLLGDYRRRSLPFTKIIINRLLSKTDTAHLREQTDLRSRVSIIDHTRTITEL